jgi:hypothetical protein
LMSDRAITAGSIVKITRTVEGACESVTTIAGREGSFSVPMPFQVHAQDVFDVEVMNPFAALGKHKLQKNAVAKARFEVNADGTLDLVSHEGAVHAKDTAQGKAPQRVHDNSDHLKRAPQFVVNDFSMHFIPRDGNTGNSASLALSVDRRGLAQAFVGLEGNEVVVTMRTQSSESDYYNEGGPKRGAHVDFASFGGGTRAWDNAAIGPIRQHMLTRQEGEEVPVRFQTTDGQVVARARVKADWGTFQTGGHGIYINEHWGTVRTAVETHKNLSFKLVPGSLHGES